MDDHVDAGSRGTAPRSGIEADGRPDPVGIAGIERYIADVSLYRRSLGTMTLDHVVGVLRAGRRARAAARPDELAAHRPSPAEIG